MDMVAVARVRRRPDFLGRNSMGVPTRAGVIPGRGPATASPFASQYGRSPGYSVTRHFHVAEEGHGYGK